MALKLKGSTSGFVAIDAPPVAGNNTIILPENVGSAQQVLANDITAGVTTFTQVTINRNGDITTPGTISIGGTLTYEDVTNIDSVGIITARNAIILSENNAIHFRGTAADDADAILRQSSGGGQLLINSRNDTILNIDSNNDSTDAHFAVASNAATGSSTELFRVQEDGNVGIGSVIPQAKLDIYRDDSTNSGTVQITQNGSGDASIDFQIKGIREYTLGIDNSDSDKFKLSTTAGLGSNDVITVTTSGAVGLGTNNPQKTLNVFAGAGTTELIRLSQRVDASVQQEFGIGWCSNNNHVHPGAKITSQEFDVSDTRRSLVFYTRGTNQDIAPTERLRIAADGHVAIGGYGDPASILDIREEQDGAETKIRLFNTDNDNTTTQTAALYLSPDSRAAALTGLRSIKENADMSTSAARDVSLTLNTLQNNSQVEAIRITSSGDVLLNKSNNQNTLMSNTSDGSDNQSVFVGGGGGASDSRGAYIWAKGNEYSSTGGFLQLNAGNVGTAPITFSTAGSEKIRIESGGSLLINTTSAVSNTKFVVAGNTNQFNPDTGTGASIRSYVLSRSYTMSTSSTNLLTFDNWGTSAFEMTVFRRDNASPAGANVTKIYLAFHGSGTNITQASIAQESKVTRGSIHTTTFGISENNNTATLTVTGDDNGGETQDFTFHIMARGNNAGTIVVA